VPFSSEVKASATKKRGKMLKPQSMQCRIGTYPEIERANVLKKCLPSDLFDELERQLAEVDGSEVNPEAMLFSFEQPPMKESWYDVLTWACLIHLNF